MGTLGYMPLECMSGTVPAREEQDVFSLAAMALLVCTSPRNARPNMFGGEVRVIDCWWVLIIVLVPSPLP